MSMVQLWERDKLASLGALREFAAKVVALKAEAGEIGLLKTMHALEPAVTEVGEEIAELLTRTVWRPKKPTEGGPK